MVIWECEMCLKRVNGDDGYICISYAHIGEAERDQREWDKRHPSGVVINLADNDLPELARWHVFHRECDPNPDSVDYHFAVGRVSTWSDLCDFTAHLMEKTWFSVTDWHAVLRAVARRHRERYEGMKNTSKATRWVAAKSLAGEGE